MIYYIDNSINSHELVLKLVNELLRPKYNDIKFYCHNLGGFDIVFILKVLTDHNDNNNDEYKINCILRDDKILIVTISKTINNHKRSFTICGSYSMLNDKLSKLAINF